MLECPRNDDLRVDVRADLLSRSLVLWRVESRTGAVAVVCRWLLTGLSPRRPSPVWPGSVSCSPGGAVARTGLRMMPTFPLLPLKFRRADFLRYGFKAGRSDGAFPSSARSSRRAVCVRPACPSLADRIPRSEPRDKARLDTSVRAVPPLYPRGPRSGPGYSVPAHPHLIDPIRPTRRHNLTSPQRLIRVVFAVHQCMGSNA